ncbi:MAG: hypothetical protein LBD77_00755 [Bifidobacteriaceae bacterium]|nr:hypothetical protein [Bifidobacteriaceae bacterium]
MKLSLKIRIGGVAAVGAAALALTGCGGAEEQPTAADTPAAESAPPSAQTAEAAPGVSGTIAAVTNALIQVQDSEKQTAVGYSAETVITEQVSGAAADVVVGSCVTAIGEAAASGGDETADAAADVFAATTVTVTPAEADGACAAGGFGGGRSLPGGGGWSEGSPSDMPSDMPSGMPGRMPSGGPSGMPGGAASGEDAGQMPGAAMMANLASGLVTAVDGDTVTVEQSGAAFGGGQDPEAASTDDPSATVTRSFTIAEAAITTTKTSDSSALQVGRCVVALGEADASGRVNAESLAVSDPGENGCSTAMGGRAAFGSGDDAGWGGSGRPDGGREGVPEGQTNSGGRPGRGQADAEADDGTLA